MQNHAGNNLFLRLMFVTVTSPMVLNTYNFVSKSFYISFLPTRVAPVKVIKRIYASDWFAPMEVNKGTPDTNNYV